MASGGGELTALRVSDMDVERRLIRIERNAVQVGSQLVEGTPKTHKVRTVPAPSVVWDMLVEQAKERSASDILFDNGRGAYLLPPTGGNRPVHGRKARLRVRDSPTCRSTTSGTPPRASLSGRGRT
ncbi:hypothetical protein GCM10009847_00960 [Leucobacter tardus]